MKIPQQMDIPGFNGKYYVTIDGWVYSRAKGKEKRLKRNLSRGVCVRLSGLNGEKIWMTMSRVMRSTYFPNMPEDYRFWHKDLQAENFQVWNLQPLPMSEVYSRSTAMRGATEIAKIDPETKEIVFTYKTAKQAAEENFISISAMYKLMSGEYGKEIAPDGFKYKRVKA